MNNTIQKPGLVIVLVGLPSSGKSTFASQLQTNLSDLYREIEIIDIDQIRVEKFGKDFDSQHEPLVIQAKMDRIKVRFQSNRALIVDDLHYYASMRHDIYQWVVEQQGICHILYISTDLKTCQAWNTQRGSYIPNSLIVDIASKFDIPGTKYGWDSPCIIYNPSLDDLVGILNTYRQILDHDLKSYQDRIENRELLESKNDAPILNFKAQLDHLSRELIGELILNRSDDPLIKELQALVLQRYHLPDFSDSTVSKILSQLRKKFIIWFSGKTSEHSWSTPLTSAQILSEFRTFLKMKL